MPSARRQAQPALPSALPRGGGGGCPGCHPGTPAPNCPAPALPVLPGEGPWRCSACAARCAASGEVPGGGAPVPVRSRRSAPRSWRGFRGTLEHCPGEPDVIIGTVRGWSAKRIDEWDQSREWRLSTRVDKRD